MLSQGKKILSSALGFILCFSLTILIPVHATSSELLASTPVSPQQHEKKFIESLKSNYSVSTSSTVINACLPPNTANQTDLSEERSVESIGDKRYEQLYGVSDEILCASTSVLLEYFLQSTFMREIAVQEMCSSSLIAEPVNYDDFYYHNEAFIELIHRIDLVDTLELFLNQISTRSLDSSHACVNSSEVEALNTLLKHPAIVSLVEKALDESLKAYPYLSKVQNDAYEVGQIVASRNNVIYRYGGKTTTAGDSNLVDVFIADNELSNDKIQQLIATYQYLSEITLISYPSSFYNCHSYAWHLFSSSNPYWIDDITPYLADSFCMLVSDSSIQVNDIIVYRKNNDAILHSGVVCSIEYSEANERKIMIQSKWGQGGIYVHEQKDVPVGYTSDGVNFIFEYYRYHDYINIFTGNDLHQGKYHIYHYADQCSICGYQTNFSIKRIACAGPPCYIPFTSMKEDEHDS